ncbi:recombinase RecT [Corynebacterium ureicelerivorans]
MTNEIAHMEAQLNTELRAAEVMAQADMLPDRFKGKPANVLVAREIAQAMGESPWVTMSELYFVGNVPTFSAKYMRSRVRAAGHVLRERFDPASMTATCTIVRHDDPNYEHTVTWDMKKANAHGLGDKGHWKKNPELMLKNRAVSECVRMACNEVMGGVDYTPDEAEHMAPVRATATRTDRPAGADGVRAALAAKREPEPEVDKLKDIMAQIKTAQDMDELKEIMDNARIFLGDEDWETVRGVANAKAGEFDA